MLKDQQIDGAGERRKGLWVFGQSLRLLNYLLKEEVGKKLEGKCGSWDVSGREREEQGTSSSCKTKEPVFTGPDSKRCL